MDIAKIRKKSKDTGLAAGPTDSPLQDESAARVEQPSGPPAQPEKDGGKAAAAQEGGDNQGAVELLIFSLVGEMYAFRINDMQEIIKLPKMTKIPRTEHSLIGIISLRGKIIPILDLKKKLSLSGGTENGKQKVLVLKGPMGPIGALVDKVIGVIKPLVSEIGETPPHLLEAETKFIEGVVLVKGRFVSIIKAEETLKI